MLHRTRTAAFGMPGAGAGLLALTLAALGDPAEAQEQPTAGALEEIVVTARKREENAQQTPVSITAFSAAGLEARAVTSVADVGRSVPNLSLEGAANLSGSAASVTTFIRGVGQTDFNLTIDPGVGIYVDGVYVSRSVGALFDTADLASVQVLRGPQGTLFGKNTIGGAVVLTSKRPSRDLELALDATTGSYDRLDLRGVLNVPVTDALRVRASASLQTRDGYVRRLSDGGRMGNRNGVSGRVVAEYEPMSNLRLTLSGDFDRRREQSLPVTLLRVEEGLLPPGSPNAGGFFSFVYNKVTAAPACGAPGQPSPRDPRCYNSQWITGDKDRTWASGPNLSNLDLWGTSLTAEWTPGTVKLKSITAYRDLKSRFNLDTDASPLPIADARNDYAQRQFSQELQLGSALAGGKLTWLVGLYYLKEKGTDRNSLNFAIADFLSGGKVDNDSYAAFAQATWRATDRLSLTLGGRYTAETKRFLPDQRILADRTGGQALLLSRCFIAARPTIPPNPGCAADPTLNPTGDRLLPFVQARTKAREFTPAVTLDYRFSPRVLGYASWSRGFKSGGFTQRVFPPEPVVPSFRPEFVTSYEAGLKSQLLDNRLRLNGAAFWTDYSDLQIVVNEGIAPKVRNAGKARIRGVEAEFELAAARWLRVSGGVGYLDARYRRVAASAAPVTTASRLPDAPRWTANLGVSADLWSDTHGTLAARADWSYKGGHYKDAVNSPDLFQPGTSVFNASLRYETADRHWSGTLGVTNLTDRRYLLGGYQDLANTSAVEATFSRPREWFLRLGYRY